jgi:hypothetical protein
LVRCTRNPKNIRRETVEMFSVAWYVSVVFSVPRGRVWLYLFDEKRRKKVVIGGTKGLEAPIPLSVSLNFTKARSRASESTKRRTRDIQVSHTSPETRNSRREVEIFVGDGGFMEGSQSVKALKKRI